MWKQSVICLLIFCGCSGFEKSEQANIRRANAKAEKILRYHDEHLCKIEPPKHRIRESYSFETYLGSHPKITKEYFRCRGSTKNPPRFLHEGVLNLCRYDCGGYDKHSLPIKEDKEFIYPILIDLLNEVQKITTKKVKITCGHRCPAHHFYAASNKENNNSKHLIGAEVDFYVEGMQEIPQQVVDIIISYYQKKYEGQPNYSSFTRVPSEDTRCKGWCNQEILIKVYQKDEGRDFDNQHAYPYVMIQVRQDRDTNQKIMCNLDQATKCFLRW